MKSEKYKNTVRVLIDLTISRYQFFEPNTTMKPIISMIAAMDESRAIGKDNKLLWHIPEDMKRFRTITLGHPIIMGRLTYESIGRVLPKRINIIVSRNANYHVEGGIVCESLKKALEIACEKDTREVFIIGGGQMYKQGIELSAKLYLTVVKGSHKADSYFPEYENFTKIARKEEKSDKNYEYTFLELEK